MTSVLPGDELCAAGEAEPGPGTYVHEDRVLACVAGRVSRSDGVVRVLRQAESLVVPAPGDVVLARVLKVDPRQTKVAILCVGETPLAESFQGQVRSVDVRQTLVDQVEMYKCFRPEDIIRAEVISLGDKNAYYLTTAKNNYGVIFARSVAGGTLIPVSWDRMQCSKTKQVEYRKVAKID